MTVIPDSVPAIELEDVTRTFVPDRTLSRPRGSQRKTVTALDGVSAVVPQGQTVALLGRNGAGKTTLTKILSTLLNPTSGSARVLGHDVVTDARRARALSTTVFGGDRGLYGMLNGYENLRYFGALNGVPARERRRRVPELLEHVGLGEAAHRRVETYSKGMRQRLHVAVGLLVRPRLLMLDEPTVGLDPIESERVRTTVAEMAAQGTTVLLTSHNLLDVERLADRVIMIASGRFTHDLPLEQFRRLTGVEAVVTASFADAPPLEVPVPVWSLGVLDELRERIDGQELVDLAVRPSTLEDAFAMAAREER